MFRRFWSPVISLFFSAVFLVAFSQTAGATSFVLGTGVGANLGCVPEAPLPQGCPNTGGGDHDATFGITGTGFISVTDQTDGFSDSNFTYSAAADAQFGILHAQASGTYSNLPVSPTSIRDAVAFAFVTDLLTITAPGQTGAGTLDVSLLLEGTLQKTAGAGAVAFAAVTAGPSQDAFDPLNQGIPFDSLTAVPSGPLTGTVNFVWGQPFYLSMIMGVAAGTPVSCMLCVGSGDANFTATSGSGSATADFFNTLRLTGLVPTDNDSPNNPVLNAQFTSDSGALYSINGIVAQPVPEPASLLLLGTGLIGAGVRRYRRKRQ